MKVVAPVAWAAAGLLAFPPVADAAFPGENGAIVYSAPQRPLEGRGLYAIDDVGKPARRLTSGYYDYSPAVSPDGRQVVFSGYSGPRLGLSVVGIEGGEPRQVPLSVPAAQPAWSPDGRVLAFTRARRTTRDIWTVRVGGTGLRRLGYGDQPAWSPDGRRLAFVAPRGGCRSVFTMRPDGSDRRLLARLAPRDVRCKEPWFRYPVTRNPYSMFSPDWSPDGRRIAFGNRRRIVLLDVVGRGRRALPAARKGVPVDVQFSPDGRLVLYGAGGDIGIVPVAGGSSRGIASGVLPAWQPR